MRTTVLFSALLLLVAGTNYSCKQATASAQGNIVKNISIALGKGDAEGVANYFPNSVGISVLQKAPVYYSKQQGKQVLSDFFKKHPPHRFDKAHAGGKNSAQFTMGDLSTSSGVFRVTFFLKNVGGKPFIQNLIIDKK